MIQHSETVLIQFSNVLADFAGSGPSSTWGYRHAPNRFCFVPAPYKIRYRVASSHRCRACAPVEHSVRWSPKSVEQHPSCRPAVTATR